MEINEAITSPVNAYIGILLEIQLPGTVFVATFEWFPFTKSFKTGPDNIFFRFSGKFT